MQNHIIFKNGYRDILICLLIFPIICQSIYAQEYPEMKVTQKIGLTIDGEDGIISDSLVMLKGGGLQKTYPLSDVQLIMVKKSWVGNMVCMPAVVALLWY